jgi:putative sterol carrier protein
MTEIPQVDPAQFAASVASTPDEQLAEGMRSEMRPMILDQIFKQMVEHFEPDKAQGTQAVVEWRIGGRADGGQDAYRLAIEDGTCTLDEDGSAGPARVTMTVGGVDFLKLITNNASGPELFMTGRLKIEGDMMFAAQVQAFFRVPEAVSGE